MHAFKIIAAALLCLFCAFAPGFAQEITFFIAPDGNDAWAGKSIEKPFATLERARDEIRMLKQKGTLEWPVTVYIRGGMYELEKPFVLDAGDSGTQTCPITYEAYPGEKPVISGGREIKGSWSPYKGKILAADVRGDWNFRQLFANGSRQARARTPNEGYFRIDETEDDIGKAAMKYRAGDINGGWRNFGDVEIVLFHSWNESILRLSRLDEEKRLAVFTGDVGGQGVGRGSAINRYYVVNTLEGLDRPGEWYHDIQGGKLYYWPHADIKTITLRSPVLKELARLEGESQGGRYIQYVTISGLTFCDADWSLPPQGYPTCGDAGDIVPPSAITLDGARFCTLRGNTIRNVGAYAIEVTGDGNVITENEIFDTGAGGIISRSYGPERNVMSYNHIHHCGEVYHSATGINIDDGGGLVSHNLIHDVTQSGVYGRHWATAVQEQERRNQEQGLIIEYNEIYNCGYLMNDSGGIFIRDSNIIMRNNLIYNHYSFKYPEQYGRYNDSGVPGWGIYLGCETRDSRVENNIIFNMTEAMHVFYGTRNVVIENNIFIDADVKHIRYETPKDLDMVNNKFVRNVVYSTSPYTELFNVNAENGLPAESDYNLFFQSGGKSPVIVSRIGIDSFEAWRARGFDKNSIVADPLFRDPASHDFSLMPDSPALKLGFKPIDLSDIGLRGRK